MSHTTTAHGRVRPGMFPGIHFQPGDPAPVVSPAGPASTLQEAVAIVLQMRQQADQDSQEFRNNWAAVNERLSELETRLARPPAGPARRDDAPPSAARSAFSKMLRRGMAHLTPEEHRTLIVGDDTAGGYLAPPEFEAEVIKAVTQISPIRSIARVTPITGRALLIPTRTSTPTAYWVNEIGTVTASEAAYGQKEIAPYTLMRTSASPASCWRTAPWTWRPRSWQTCPSSSPPPRVWRSARVTASYGPRAS